MPKSKLKKRRGAKCNKAIGVNAPKGGKVVIKNAVINNHAGDRDYHIHLKNDEAQNMLMDAREHESLSRCCKKDRLSSSLCDSIDNIRPRGINFQRFKKYEKPRPSFKKTNCLTNVLELVDINKIVHLYGMSGSGKSQIVAAVCEKLDHHPGCIVWRVQCQTGTGILKREWREFVQNLQQTGAISPEDATVMRTALNQGTEVEMRKFMDIINRMEPPVPIMFAIEDIVDDDEKYLVKSLINCMDDTEPSILNLQLLFATQDKEVFFSEIDLRSLHIYKTYNVQGFSKEEAFEFLCTSDLPIEDKEKVAKLSSELAYSPLGLLVTKSYCMKYRVSYEEYYDSLGKNEDVQKEIELLKEHPDLGKHHRYEVIMKLLFPAEHDDEEKHIQFKVMRMMSFLSNQDIPCQLVEKFFQHVGCTERTSKPIRDAKYLLERLRREVDANVQQDTHLLTLHADILRVLNISIQAEQRQQVLGDMVLALASLLDKDNRVTKHYALLHDLKNHAAVVAQHSVSHFTQLFRGTMARTKDFEILLGLSKLNEVIGFAISQHQGFREGNEEDKYFQQAMDCIWVIVCANSERSFLPSWLSRKKETTKQLVSYEPGKDPYTTAKEVFKRVKEASSACAEIKEALRNDWKRSFPVKESHLIDMREKLGEECKIDWEKMKEEIQEKGQLSDKCNEELKAHEMIVDWKLLIECYLIERMASILHSRGRQDNYKGDIISSEMHIRCAWYAEFGYQLCDIAFKKTGIKSLFHYILRANNKLPRLIRNVEGESDRDFLKRINKSREFAFSLMREGADFYEHGIYKPISGTPWTFINTMKYLVKANTKAQKRPAVAKAISSLITDEECEELCKLCENNKNLIMPTKCLVHAGKYLAARGEYTKALDTIESAFLWGIEERLEENPPTYCWALYNMGRVILAANNKLHDRQIFVERFNERYEQTKMNKTPDKWKSLLDDCSMSLGKLSTMSR